MVSRVFILLLLSSFVWGQNIVDQIDTGSVASVVEVNAITERIKRISSSKRIFIITNQNNLFAKGDFITLILEKRLTAKALVAKISGRNAGIKILRIYSLNQWNKLRENLDIEVVRGDDRALLAEKEEVANPSDENPIIASEEDLFDATKLLEEDIALEEERNSVIKNDNVIAFSLGLIEANATNGDMERHAQPSISWAYQIEEDIWIEGSYGRNVIGSFPNSGLDTTVNNFTVKIKYAVEAPLYSVVLPYVGYQYIDADSPNAGVNDEDNTWTPAQLQSELDDVAALEKNHMVFGALLLKRLVPGWFVKINVGSDILSGGLALEF